MADVTRTPDRRAVSTTVGYVLNLAVALLLVTGLLTAAGTFVEDQRQLATQDELGVVGERFTAGLATADRLATTGDSGHVDLRLPTTVAGHPYQIRVFANHTVVLATDTADISVTTTYPDAIDGLSGTVDGGTVRISFDASGVEVTNA
ncbi:DUF7266 family protein [Halocalculus aciditolerans]|uniref:Secreted glycoprotein n=1 Tax=Halocalculus aciditolerans TaxID=1383812 RepID=A0A830F6A8_9EURY|nr:hypothetical protein [Halocalculus aciditolerans]GGL58733.1 hypothetical protein GCM10009039_16220 [Halocalculus aciditolerans]